MNETINLGKRVKTVDIAPEFSGVSKLVCHIDNETQLVVGDDSGYTLEFDNPLMTQAVLNAMLTKIRGYQYAPIKASEALLDPSAEVGDGISANGDFSALFNRRRNFGRLMKADIEAPADEEIDHEFKFETSEQRKYKRDMGNVRATLLIQSNQISAEVEERTAQGEQFAAQLTLHSTEIAAKVNATGGNNSSFGWTLNSTSHTWYAGSQEVMKVTASGLEVKGKITATSGYIGNGSNGFTISSTAIYNGISSFGGTQSSGVYLGTNGIQLGQNFKVTNTGAVTASSLTVTGGSININNKFIVTSQGVLTADLTSGSITLGRDANNNPVFQVTSGGAVTARSLTLVGGSINIADKFKVTAAGAVTATNLSITGGSINIANKFIVNSAGAVTATNLTISGGSINIGNAFKVSSAGAVTATNLSITGGSINIGSKFIVNSAGAVSASNLTITGGSINIGSKFIVNSAGAVTASSLTITGGSININNAFRVDSAGNLTANSGTFLGSVNAGNVRYGGSYGTFNGGGITGGSIAYDYGGAMATGWFSGAVNGNNFGSMTVQGYTADWVCANHIICYSNGNINGRHYGEWVDDESHHFASWKSASVIGGGSVDVGFGKVFKVEDINGQERWCGNALWGSFSPSGGGTIKYVGRT